MRSRDPLFRREKRRPCDDFYHTLKVGIPAAVVLAVALPLIFRMMWG